MAWEKENFCRSRANAGERRGYSYALRFNEPTTDWYGLGDRWRLVR